MNSVAMKKKPISLTLRMILFVVITIGICLFFINQMVLQLVERHFSEQDTAELIVMNQAIYERLQMLPDSNRPKSDILSHAVSGHHGVFFQVRDIRGKIVYTSPNFDLSGASIQIESNHMIQYTPAIKIRGEDLKTWQTQIQTYRGTVSRYAVGDSVYIIITAIDMGFHKQFLRSFRKSLALIMMFAGLATLLAVWFGVFQGLAPLRRLSVRVRGIEANKLDFRLETNAVPKELQELVQAFNQMINGLEKSFKRLSSFSADIAHELRTPLTNIITQTQVGLSKPRDIEEYKNLLYSNLEEQERLAKMVNDMLWLAKSDHGFLKPVLERIDLRKEIDDLFEFFEAFAEEQRLSLKLEGENQFIEGDRAMLRQAFSNLLSNALRFATKETDILIRLGSSRNFVIITIENSCDQIAEHQLEKLFDRFYRVDPARQRHSEGAGLGLSIVQSIIEAHDGHVEAISKENIISFRIYLPKIAL